MKIQSHPKAGDLKYTRTGICPFYRGNGPEWQPLFNFAIYSCIRVCPGACFSGNYPSGRLFP